MRLQLNLTESLHGRNAWMIGLAIFLLNLGLKLLFLDAQPIAGDEPFTLFWAQRPLADIWELAKNENNPPLHFMVEHFWIQAFGWSVTALRFSSLLCASLAAMVLFLSANRHFGLFAGLVAALLFTLSTEYVYHAHEVRTYALLSLLTIAAVDRYLRLVEAPRRWQHYLWLGIFNMLLIYSHFLGIWIILAQVACWPLMPQRRPVAGRLTLMLLAVALAYAPNLYAFLLRLQSVADAGTWVAKPHWTQLYGHINIFLNGPVGTAALLLLLGLGIAWMLIGKKSRAASFKALGAHRSLLIACSLFAVVYGGIYVQSLLFTPAFIPRYLLFTSMPLFLAVAGLLHFLIGHGRLQLASLLVIACAMVPWLQLNPSNHRDLKGLVAFVQANRTAETPLIICPDYFDKTFAFHDDLPLFQDYAHFGQGLADRRIFPITSHAALPWPLLAASPKVIFLDADARFTHPDNGILDSLRTRFPRVAKTHFEEIFDVYVLEK